MLIVSAPVALAKVATNARVRSTVTFECSVVTLIASDTVPLMRPALLEESNGAL
jgi:hypothetical protein